MSSRRTFVAGALGAVAAGVAWSSPGLAEHGVASTLARTPPLRPRSASPMPVLGPTGVIHDGVGLGAFGIDSTRHYPDVRSHRLKIGVLLPATNTSVEHELWRLVFDNREVLDGVGLHTTPVITPRPVLRTPEDLDGYKQQFVAGLGVAIDHALLGEPDLLLMAMSLEHILHGLPAIREVMDGATARAPLPWATWHAAAEAALRSVGARRIGLITPFDARGNDNARKLFEDLGFEVVSSVGFACTHALHIAHVPDEAKERAVVELLAPRRNRLDAVVQCGTNMSFIDVAERLEPRLELPLLGINAVTFWHALRQSGIHAPLQRGSWLLRER